MYYLVYPVKLKSCCHKQTNKQKHNLCKLFFFLWSFLLYLFMISFCFQCHCYVLIYIFNFSSFCQQRLVSVRYLDCLCILQLGPLHHYHTTSLSVFGNWFSGSSKISACGLFPTFPRCQETWWPTESTYQLCSIFVLNLVSHEAPIIRRNPERVTRCKISKGFWNGGMPKESELRQVWDRCI